MDIRKVGYGVAILLLMLASGVFYYTITGQVIADETHTVTRIIDGDTLEIENNQKVRLLGINTPEKKMPLFNEATEFLQKTENKTINLENYGTDQYGRILGHVFMNNRHLNKEILENGLGTLYYYGEDTYYESLKQAEESARLSQRGVWKKSSKANCLELVKLKYTEEPERCTNNEQLIIENSCNNPVQLMFKDDATHIYYEIIKPKSRMIKNFSCIFNDAGDSLYAFDQEGMLLFYRY